MCGIAGWVNNKEDIRKEYKIMEDFLKKRPLSLDADDGVSLAQVERVKIENQKLKQKHEDVKHRLDQMISKISHQMEVQN